MYEHGNLIVKIVINQPETLGLCRVPPNFQSQLLMDP
jgi:hypothetical protein